MQASSMHVDRAESGALTYLALVKKGESGPCISLLRVTAALYLAVCKSAGAFKFLRSFQGAQHT